MVPNTITLTGFSEIKILPIHFVEIFCSIFHLHRDHSILIPHLDRSHCASSVRYSSWLSVCYISDTEKCLTHCKNGKTSGLDGLMKGNVSCFHLSIIIHLKLLFNVICEHGFVRYNFCVFCYSSCC